MHQQKLINQIRHSVIGEHALFQTPFGSRPLVYADYTASGRALSFIEDFICAQVLPCYANTHTESSYSGAQTTAYMEQARAIISQAVNASQDYCVLFCGAGATAAVHKLIGLLCLSRAEQGYMSSKPAGNPETPLVLIGPYEHHSNELPWRESQVELVRISLNKDGHIDIAELEQVLIASVHRPVKIGSFSAASNVTGIKTDTDRITRLLKKHGAYACWDYAAAAPYTRIDMLGRQGPEGDTGKDAVFISPHKFVGGPGSSGILVVKKSLIKNTTPVVPGGGTVRYVSPGHHVYHDDPEKREEGGTPDIIGAIRAGLAFKLQQAVGMEEIEQREQSLIRQSISRLLPHPCIEILGNPEAERLAILSFQIKRLDKYLHYGFIVALLNDLFGIQARGGCSCAGPYAHDLLGMDSEYSLQLEQQVLRGNSIMRPGWVRLSFNYFFDTETTDYIIRAIELIAEQGWKLLSYYDYDEATGIWVYHANRRTLNAGLGEWDFQEVGRGSSSNEVNRPKRLTPYLGEAERRLAGVEAPGPVGNITLSKSARQIRWFYLPQDERGDEGKQEDTGQIKNHQRADCWQA